MSTAGPTCPTRSRTILFSSPIHGDFDGIHDTASVFTRIYKIGFASSVAAPYNSIKYSLAAPLPSGVANTQFEWKVTQLYFQTWVFDCDHPRASAIFIKFMKYLFKNVSLGPESPDGVWQPLTRFQRLSIARWLYDIAKKIHFYGIQQHTIFKSWFRLLNFS